MGHKCYVHRLLISNHHHHLPFSWFVTLVQDRLALTTPSTNATGRSPTAHKGSRWLLHPRVAASIPALTPPPCLLSMPLSQSSPPSPNWILVTFLRKPLSPSSTPWPYAWIMQFDPTRPSPLVLLALLLQHWSKSLLPFFSLRCQRCLRAMAY